VWPSPGKRLDGISRGRAAALENKRMLVPRLNAAADELPALRTQVAGLRASAGARRLTLEGTSDGSPAGEGFPQWCSDRDAIAMLQDLVD
jgi:hypothetical protein